VCMRPSTQVGGAECAPITLAFDCDLNRRRIVLVVVFLAD